MDYDDLLKALTARGVATKFFCEGGGTLAMTGAGKCMENVNLEHFGCL